jgi:hypothetical protein
MKICYIDNMEGTHFREMSTYSKLGKVFSEDSEDME